MTTQYDLTGINPDYLISDQRYVVYQDTQVIDLPGPAYPTTIVISQVDGGVVVPLIAGVDWSIRDSDLSSTATSKAKLTDASFDIELATSITMHKTPEPQYTISVSYQQLELNRIVANLNSETDLSFTPELLLDILQNISYLRNFAAPSTDGTGTSDAIATLLIEDLYGTSVDNLIENEIHTVDVPNETQVIRPVQGAFYRDSVVVTVVASAVVLTAGTDYVIGGFDISRTKASKETGGVFKHIYITTPVVGDISIDYQAFGGETTTEDLRQLQTNLTNIYTYLNNSQFVTRDTLGQADIVDTLIRRMTQVEERMRILTTTGSPSYGDKTNGIARLYRFTAADTDKHWFDLSSLYTVSGSADVITQDRVHYRIRTVESKMMFDVYIAANLYDYDNPFSIRVTSDLSYKGYTPYKNYDDLDNRIHPSFRVIWNDVTDVRSGALLQIGLAFKNIVTETLVVEDLSGNECCWILQPVSATAITNHDNTVLLPDTTSIWDKTVSTSNKVEAAAPLEKGYLGWAGSMTTATLSTLTVLNHFFDKRDIKINQIKVLDCQFFDRYKGIMVSAPCVITKPIGDIVTIGGATQTAITLSGEEFFHMDDLCKVKITITQSDTDVITVSVITAVGEESEINERFELRQIIAMF